MATSKERPKLVYNDPLEAYVSYFRIINNIIQGGLDTTGTVTLTTSTTTTTVSSTYVTPDSYIGLSPTTANAAGALSTTYVSTKSNGAYFVLTHSNTATADRTFIYSIIG